MSHPLCIKKALLAALDLRDIIAAGKVDLTDLQDIADNLGYVVNSCVPAGPAREAFEKALRNVNAAISAAQEGNNVMLRYYLEQAMAAINLGIARL